MELPEKKRGRKPKGCKMIMSVEEADDKPKHQQNIILHLKCSSKAALEWLRNGNQPAIEEAAETPFFSNLVYDPGNIRDVEPFDTQHGQYTTIIEEQTVSKPEDENEDTIMAKYLELKQYVNRKIAEKVLEIQHKLHKNELNNTKSNCFWDGCPFSGAPVYIPISDTEGKGCFCCPECACGYNMNDNTIDDATRWERYYKLNNIYGKAYNKTENIRPAPDPRYFLNHYLGTMTIDEYREMIGSNKLWIILDKPLTRVLPELHEERSEVPIYSMNLMSKTNSRDEEKTRYKLSRKKPLPNKNVDMWGTT